MANYIDKIKLQDTSYELHDARITAIDTTPTLDSSTNTATNTVMSHGIFNALSDIQRKYGPARDLSQYDIHGNNTGSRNTANTYVVLEPRKYMFPLVYGNGIKNGTNNTAAYNRADASSATKTEILSGTEYPNAIASPFIDKDLHPGQKMESSNYTPSLLWQTDPNFIISMDTIEKEDTYYIQFQVNTVPSTNAIAHIAVIDKSLGYIVWSWMIWGIGSPTDLEEIMVTNKTGVNYTMLKTPLGTIWDESRGYYVTPYYQWGRKDPMYPAGNTDATAENTIALYNINGESISNTIKTDQAKRLENSVKNPDVMYVQSEQTDDSGKWCTLDGDKAEYCNFWNNAAEIDTSTPYAGLIDNKDTAVKTIYDPCPVGFMVPTALWATGFSDDGYTVQSYSNNIDPDKVIGEWSRGYVFKRFPNDQTGWKICANGFRNDQGNIEQGRASGNYWMSGVAVENANPNYLSSWKFQFNSSVLSPHIVAKYSDALGIIPMKET